MISQETAGRVWNCYRERHPKKKSNARKPWVVMHCFNVDGTSAWKTLNAWHKSGAFATEKQARESVGANRKGDSHGWSNGLRGGYRLIGPDGSLIEEFIGTDV